MTRPTFAWITLGSLLLSAPVLANEKSKALYESGMAAGMGGDIEKAKTLLEQAVKADPTDFLAMFDLGGAQEELRQYEAAAKSYSTAATLKPEFAEAQTQAGTLYLMNLKQTDRAIKHFRAALLTRTPWVDPRFPISRTRTHALQNLAVAFAEQGAFGLAAAVAENALVDADGDVRQRRQLEAVRQRARDDGAEASKLDNPDLIAVGLAVYGEKPVSPAEAVVRYKAFEKSASLDKLTTMEKWSFFDGTGLALAMSGQIAASMPYFDKALAVSTPLPVQTRAESTYNKTCSLASLGQVDQAFAAFEEVLWLEYVTKRASDWKGHKPFAKQARTDESLANLRKDARLEPLLERYQ